MLGQLLKKFRKNRNTGNDKEDGGGFTTAKLVLASPRPHHRSMLGIDFLLPVPLNKISQNTCSSSTYLKLHNAVLQYLVFHSKQTHLD